MAYWGGRGQAGRAIVGFADAFSLPDPARELKILISNLLELLTEVGVSGQGRDNALSLLIKTVPRKSLKDPNNSLTLWVIDQGRRSVLKREKDPERTCYVLLGSLFQPCVCTEACPVACTVVSGEGRPFSRARVHVCVHRAGGQAHQREGWLSFLYLRCFPVSVHYFVLGEKYLEVYYINSHLLGHLAGSSVEHAAFFFFFFF